ncbi:DUF1853 family protein [Neptunomonas antarctica]|uniref:DUF1853 domain-containing protein n=1 Tax=Neptunomonas antarctica TaxID=619304 RepID=A0A1N7PIU5_9GAMM|nr:DUF1853 family protein [Neptunomonas antarctica]SIT10476.1 hypothetical protein SAMN05421760_11545 [Neptunomonas antarctica]
MKDRLVIDIEKDLQWFLNTKALMNTPATIEQFTAAEHLIGEQDFPPALMNYPAPPAYRLGLQFEDCIELLFKHSTRSQLLYRNLIIKYNRRVIGELDCLYQNAAGDNVHLELAIKFYLLHPPFSGLECFIGPGGRDRLDIKWQRLLQHQLPLSLLPETLNTLNELGVKPPVKHELLLTGMLFYPYQNWTSLDVPFLCVNPQHHRGWWLFQNQIHLLSPEIKSQYSFFILPRWHWMGGISHYETLQPLNYQTLIEHVLMDDEPKMVVIIKKNEEWLASQKKGHKEFQEEWQEVSRGFIVRNNWPETKPKQVQQNVKK